MKFKTSAPTGGGPGGPRRGPVCRLKIVAGPFLVFKAFWEFLCAYGGPGRRLVCRLEIVAGPFVTFLRRACFSRGKRSL